MLRDLKFFRRNSAKNPVEEIENMPLNPTDLSAIQSGADAMRPPLTTIPDSTHAPKQYAEPELAFQNKVDRTPTKSKGKSSDTALQGRTPEKQGIGHSGKNRFGWGSKNDPNSVVPESRVDGSQMSRGVGFGNGIFPNITPRSTRTVGKATSAYSECNSTQSTPTKSVTKPPNPGFRTKIDGNGNGRPGNFAQLYKGVPVSCGPSTMVNTVEVPHFDLREDPSFWMDHNVQVSSMRNFIFVFRKISPFQVFFQSIVGFFVCLMRKLRKTERDKFRAFCFPLSGSVPYNWKFLVNFFVKIANNLKSSRKFQLSTVRGCCADWC